MSNQDGNPKSVVKSSELDAFDAKLKAMQSKHKPKDYSTKDDGTLLGMAWRMSTELLVSVLVGLGLGMGLDHLFGTKPWFLFLGLGFGIAAGIKTVLMTAEKMDAQTKHLPIGDDLPDDKSDD
ncbi:AtpZ/AtpI family protein [Fretibacter rubidus]|uniref:AtpZ/AtpI family protein n=1 Tax=Fretibacter rubidus TaxID=570162 RepID=UPI003529ED89